MAKVGFPLGLGLLFLFCNGFFPFVKKKKKKKRLKCIGGLGGVICFFGRNFRTWDKKKALDTSTKASFGKNWLCILILSYLN